MQVTIIIALPTEGPWSVWLQRPVKSAELDTYYEPNAFEGDGRFLVLIHYSSEFLDGDKEKADEIERKWRKLPDSLRTRVWWLIYSGTGYRNLESAEPNVHYFRYPIDRGSDSLGDDQKAHFLQFVCSLE